MNDRPHLRGLPRLHDLPPLWDDRPVTWGAWHSAASSAWYHLPLRDLACRHCGLLEPGLITGGKVHPLPGDPGPAHPQLVLHAYRCACGVDTVHDIRTGETWILDDTDYGDTGSHITTGTLW